MKPSEHARKFYGKDWDGMLAYYVEYHFVYASPTAICLAKPEGNCWWIEYLAGDMKEVLGHLPFWLTYISYSRNGIVKVHATATLVNRLLKNDPVQDGSVDALSWWRWPRTESKTSASSITHYCGGESGQDKNPGPPA
jgi:hypothetical protein